MNQKNLYESFAFPEHWMAVTQSATSLETELRKEMIEGHPLFSLPIRAIAKRRDSDDVLFEVDSPNFRFAKVHLTFLGLPEKKPEWPFTEFFMSIDDLLSHERNQSG